MGELKDIIINIGVVAGVASIVGLAVLAMLYFSQARDVRRLREWAGREPERAAEVELRAAQIASQAIAQAYESMALRQSEADAAAQIAAEQGVEISGAPLVAAGVAEQIEGVDHPEPVTHGLEGAADDPEHLAQEAARHAESEQAEDSAAASPEGEQASQEDEAAEAAVVAGQNTLDDAVIAVETPAEEPAAEPLVAAEAAGAAASFSVSQPTQEHDVLAEDHPEPVTHGLEGAADDPEHLAQEASETQAPAGEPPADVRPSRLAPSTPAASRVPLPPLPPLDTSEFLAVNRPLPNVSPDYYSSLQSTGSGSYEAIAREPEKSSRTPMIIASVLVLAFAIVVAATQFGGSSDSGQTARRSSRDQKTVSTSRRNQRVNRPAVTVSVLNGTQTAGLANLVKDQLSAVGFTETTTGNRNDGVDHATSTVYYTDGKKIEAQEVAKELDIKAVKEIDSDTQAAGGAAAVVVVLGADIDQ